MNYIACLQNQLNTAKTALAEKAEAIQAFRIHLASNKFAGTDPDGSRRDWIAVNDVQAWLAHISGAGA